MEQNAEYRLYAVQQGVPDAQYHLWVLMQHGYDGITAAKATRWLRKAAEQGNTVVQFYLSDPYSEGSGAEQDYRKHTSTYRQQHRLATQRR